MKQCTKCNEWKEESEFYKDKSRKDGLFPWCLQCKKENEKARYRKKPKNGKGLMVECVQCRTLFYLRPSEEKNGHYYCSRECYNLMRRDEPVITRLTKSLFKQIKGNAKKRNLEFNLEIKDIIKVIKENKCYYCGKINPHEHVKRNHGRTIGSLLWPGIDRINSNEGYIKGNIQPCCKTCNIMKQDLSEMEFLSHISKIFINNKKRKENETAN